MSQQFDVVQYGEGFGLIMSWDGGYLVCICFYFIENYDIIFVRIMWKMVFCGLNY